MKLQTSFLFILLDCLIVISHVYGMGPSIVHNIKVEERQILDDLCPKVDICDLNATSAVVEPNGLIRRGFISCCKGCSCHKDCKEELNCCFSDNNNRNGDNNDPKRECLYTRIGQPNDNIPVIVPAYQTIIQAPSSGCVENESLTIGPNQVVYPTCEDNYFSSLGSYFPVYSPKTDLIYKNVLCARCHGVEDSIPFVPKLACRGSREFPISMSEQLYFLETGLFTTQCFMDFSYGDPSIISTKQCYRNVVKTCESNEIKIPSDIDLGIIDIEMVKPLCEMGLYSPMVLEEKVYRNAFCALCGQTPFKDLLCLQDPTERTDDDTLVHLLDTTMLARQVLTSPETHQHPEVCMTKNNVRTSDRCKRLYCSSGKIRNTNGDCVFITNSWSSGTILIQLKLVPKRSDQHIRKIIQETDVEVLVQAITKQQPWPESWSIMRLMRRQDESNCSERSELTIIVETESNNLEQLYNDIKSSTNDLWTINLNGSSFQFHQKFHDYMLASTDQINVMRPFWQSEILNLTFPLPYNGCKNIYWEQVFARKSFRSTPVQITKLILCKQITLVPGEFTVGGRGSYLQSNLTKRVLLKFEFDLVLMKGYHARVCLADTIFSVKQKSVGALMASVNVTAVLILAIFSSDFFAR